MATVIGSSLAAARTLVLLQLGCRLATFALNQLVLRYTSPAIFGFATVQLELMTITIHFLSREGFRLAVQRVRLGNDRRTSQIVVNLSYLPVAAGNMLTVLGCIAYFYFAAEQSRQVPFFRETVSAYGAATILELFSEPFYAIVQTKLLYSIRAAAEGAAVLVKCIVTFMTTYYAMKAGDVGRLGALPFALGQLCYAAILLIVYAWFMVRDAKRYGYSVLGRSVVRDKHRFFFDQPMLRLIATMTAQSFFKHILTEGDKFLIGTFASNTAQGLYAAAANYGSLLARILFQPIEESSRALFGKLQDRRKAKIALELLLHGYFLIGLFAVSIGPHAAPVLLALVAGSRWADAGEVLGVYAYYIPFLAVNGVTEAFVQSMATPTDLRRQSEWMVVFSIVFAGSGFLLMHWLELGAVGLIWANIINMAMRISWSWHYTVCRVGALQALPGAGTTSAAVVVACIARSLHFEGVEGLFKVAFLATSLLFICAILERPYFQQMYKFVQSRDE